MDTYDGNGKKDDPNHQIKKKISKTDIGMPLDFVHVATVRSPTKTEVNFNDALISEFLHKAEVSSSALSDPETQTLIKEFIQKVGLDAIRRELCQPKDEVDPCINVENKHETVQNSVESDSHSLQIQSNDSTSIAIVADHDIEITPEIDDVFTEPDTSAVPPISPKKKGLKQLLKNISESPSNDRYGSERHVESKDSQVSPKPSDSDHIKASVLGNSGTIPKKKPDHDNFLRELKAAIKRRNARMKRKAADEMKKSEEGWSNWSSPKKSKSYVSFFQFDSQPAKPTRTVHTFWDLTSESHYISETDISDKKGYEIKDIENLDSQKLSPNHAKIPLTKRTGAITKMASSEEIGKITLLSSPEESYEDSKTINLKDVHEGENVGNLKLDESNKENIPAETNDQEPCLTVEDVLQGGNTDEIGKEPSKDILNKDKSSQKKNISSWFTRKNQKKAMNKEISEGLPVEELKATPTEQGCGHDSDLYEMSHNTEEEKKVLSIFGSLSKKKQTKEKSQSKIENDTLITLHKGKEQTRSKISSSKFKLFGSSEKLLDCEKNEEEYKEEKEGSQIIVSSSGQNDDVKEITHTTVGKFESSETTKNSELQKNDTESLHILRETSTVNSTEVKENRKEETTLSKSKMKSTSMKNLLFSSGKYSKQKVEKEKEEYSALEKNELTSHSDNISNHEDGSISKKRSGIVKLFFSPPEKRSKQKGETSKPDSENEERVNEKDIKITSNDADIFVEIPLSDDPAETEDDSKDQEPPTEEVKIAGDIEPKNDKNISSPQSKEKTPGKKKYLFSTRKQSKNKSEDEKGESTQVKEEVCKEKVSASLRDEDRNDYWDKSKHSAFVNLLFAPPERHAKKTKSKEKNQDKNEKEELSTTVSNETVKQISYKEKIETPSNDKESLIERSLSTASAEILSEIKEDCKIINKPSQVIDNQSGENVLKEDKRAAENEEKLAIEMNTSVIFKEVKYEMEGDNEIIYQKSEESPSGMIEGKEINYEEEKYKNKTEYPAEMNSTEKIKEGLEQLNKSQEIIPAIIITQDEELLKEGEIFASKEEISSDMTFGEYFIDSKDSGEKQMLSMDMEECIIKTEEEHSTVESKEISSKKEDINKITKLYDGNTDEVICQDFPKEIHELPIDKEVNQEEEKTCSKISLSTTVSYITEASPFEENPLKKEKDLLEATEENERSKNITMKEESSSEIMYSLSARSEKQVKPEEDKIKINFSEKEELKQDTLIVNYGSLNKEGSASKMDSLGHVGKQTDIENLKVSEDQGMIETTSIEVPNPGEGMDTNLDRVTFSSRMHSLFGSTGKSSSKQKNNLKQNSKKEDLSSTTTIMNKNRTQVHSKEEVSSSLNKTKSSSMRKLSFGKHAKPKEEDIITLKASKNEEDVDKDGKNPTHNEERSSIEYSKNIKEKSEERKQEMKEQDGIAVTAESQEETGKKSLKQEEDSRTPREKNPTSEKTGFFSLPNRKGKVRNEALNKELIKPEELKEKKENRRHSSQRNLHETQKKGLLSSLDKRKKVRHGSRKTDVSLDTGENVHPMSPKNKESINENEISPSRTEISANEVGEFPNERAVDVGGIYDSSYELKSKSKEDLLKSSTNLQRKGRARRELKKEDISLQKDMRQTTHVTWDPIKKNFILHYTDSQDLRQILLEENLCHEGPTPRQRRHSYSLAINDSDTETFEEIPRASIQSYSSVTSNLKSSGKRRRKAPFTRPRSEIMRVNQPTTEL